MNHNPQKSAKINVNALMDLASEAHENENQVCWVFRNSANRSSIDAVRPIGIFPEISQHAMEKDGSALIWLTDLFRGVFYLIGHPDFYGGFCGCNRWQFKNRDELLWLTVGPSVTALSLWVPGNAESFYIAIPDGLTVKHFMHGHGKSSNPSRIKARSPSFAHLADALENIDCYWLKPKRAD